jgi:hypothetical protein
MAFCPKLLRFVRVRAAQLDPDGTFAAGAKNLYVTDTNVSLAIGYNNEAGDDFTQKNGSGDICYAFLDTDKYKNLTFGLVFCDHDPEAQVLFLGGKRLVAGAETIGAALPRVGTAGNADGVSLEGWTLNIAGSGIDPSYPYIRFVFGKTRWSPADKSLENNPIVQSFTGVGYENENFFDGPANDWDFTAEGEHNTLMAYAGDTDLPDSVCGTQTLAAAS